MKSCCVTNQIKAIEKSFRMALLLFFSILQNKINFLMKFLYSESETYLTLNISTAQNKAQL